MKILRYSREKLLLFGILTIAFILRAWGVGFGLPFLYHADEPIVVNHALAFGMGDLNPHFFNIPPLVSYLLFFCYGIYCVIGCATGSLHSVRDFELLFYSDPSLFYLIARLVFGVFLGTLSVYVLFRLVKKFADTHAALWASFFFAVNFLHVRDSHYIYVDIPLLFVLLLGFVLFSRMAEKDKPRKSSNVSLHVLAGAAIGLAMATKYNGVFLAIPYLWICLRTVPWKKWPLCWFLAGLATFVTFVVLNPYSVLDHAFFMKSLVEQSAANSGGLPWLHHLTYSLAGALGWPLLVLAFIGVLRAFFSREAKWESMGLFVVAYYVILCHFGQPYDRYVLPLIPFMLVLAVQVLAWIEVRSKLLFWVLIPFVILPSIIKTVHWDRLMSEPDVRTVAKKWVEAHIPSGSRLALDWGFYMPRLAFSPGQLQEKRSRAAEGLQSGAKMRRLDAMLSKPYQPSYELHFLSKEPEGSAFLFAEPLIPFDMETLKREGIQYVLLIDALLPSNDPFFQALQENADRVMTFSPYRDPEDLTIRDPQTMTGGPSLWKDILSRERGGYPISIYRLHS